jgi:hypothetical protein
MVAYDSKKIAACILTSATASLDSSGLATMATAAEASALTIRRRVSVPLFHD